MARAGTVKAAAAWVAPAVAAALWCAVAGAAQAAPRVALVVGNAGYDPSNIVRLANPVNDARLMAKTLESIDFEVSLVTDADRNAMTEAIEGFGKRLRRAGSEAVGLFYYAGHGVEVGGVNYLIPLGAEIESAMEFQGDAVPAQWVLSWIEAAGNRLNMVVLDACRNNPYGGKRGGERGLARMDAPSGSLIAYAAGPGQAADDGEGGNSPYTSALAEALLEPGLKVEDVFKRVRVRVERETGGDQTPWESSSLKGDFHFLPREAAEEAPPVAGGGTSAADEARNAYDTAVRENTIAAYRAVMEHFPGFYATLARAKVEELEAAALAEERRARREALAEKLGRELSPDAVGENGWTDLHWAAALDLPGLARELVERGMGVDVRLDESGERFGESLNGTLWEFGLNFYGWTRTRTSHHQHVEGPHPLSGRLQRRHPHREPLPAAEARDGLLVRALVLADRGRWAAPGPRGLPERDRPCAGRLRLPIRPWPQPDRGPLRRRVRRACRRYRETRQPARPRAAD